MILEETTIGFAVIGTNDRWLRVNGAFASVLGYEPEALIGKGWVELTPPDDAAEMAEKLRRIREGDAPSLCFEVRLLTKSGAPLWVEMTAARVTADGIPDRAVLLMVREVSSRRESDRGMSIQYLVSRILASSTSVDSAIQEILAEVGKSLRWSFGSFWTLDQDKNALVASQVWRSPAHVATSFETLTRGAARAKGEGIPGRVWAENAPLWETDAQQQDNFPRFRAAKGEGLHAAFAFPVTSATEFHGVIEFFSEDVLPPDATLLNAAEGIGYQIGQFLERTRAQTAGNASEIRKASILDTALDGIITIDGKGTIIEFNPAAERMFGYAKEDVLGKEMTDLIVPPSLRKAHRSGMRRYLTTGEAHVLGRRIEINALRSDGTEFPIELAIVRVPLPGPVFFTAYMHDLTLRKRIETEQKFLLNASAELSSSLDYETTLSTVANLAVPQIADWCTVDLVAADGSLKRVAVAHKDPEKVAAVNILERDYPADPTSQTGVHEVVRTGKTQWAADISDDLLKGVAKDEAHLNALRDLSLRSYIIVPLRTRNKTLGALTLVSAESGHRFTLAQVELAEDLATRMAIAIDNALLLTETERSRVTLSEQANQLEANSEEMAAAHEELEVSNEELAATNEELQRRTNEVVAALAAAEEANRAKSDFLATMSHELRTPLNAIGGYAELIKLGIRGPVTAQQTEDLERIQRSQNQLLTLINDILKFAKLQSGTIEFQIHEFSLDEMLSRSDDLVRPQIDKKRLSYAYEPGDPRVTVCADQDRFQQVVLNLLSNAVKFTPEGGEIRVSWKAGEKEVAINISDNGIGIPQEKLGRVFDPFVQVNAPSAKINEGVGLGLAISRDIVDRMKGKLTVASEVGKGAVFTFTLPRGKDLSAG